MCKLKDIWLWLIGKNPNYTSYEQGCMGLLMFPIMLIIGLYIRFFGDGD